MQWGSAHPSRCSSSPERHNGRVIGLAYARWAELDPATHPFEVASARPVIAALVTAHDDREALTAAIDRALIAAHGTWIGGWRWAASEPGGGGPVRGWCCARDSLLRGGEPLAATDERELAAIADWRGFLDELAARYAQLDATTRGWPLEDTVEYAAAELLPLALRGDATDAWYATFARLLEWYLDAGGLAGDEAAAAIYAVASGRFQSWIGPSDEVAAAACKELGEKVAGALADKPPRDALRRWLAVRGEAFAQSPPAGDAVVIGDAHERFVDEVDRARDPVRAERIGAALVLARDAARRGVPLTFDQLAECQAIVLGGPAPLRATDAFGKYGREIYPWRADLQARFEACLGDAASAEPPHVRAARVYLDVCFFHPFADGNARAARIALDYVLTGAGLALHAAEPLFVIARGCDARSAYQLARAIGLLSGATGARSR